MNKKTRLILLIVIALFIVGMAVYPSLKKYFGKENEKGNSPSVSQTSGGSRKPLNVNVKILKYGVLNDIFRTTGILMPDEEVDLSFETSGKITNIYFTEGTEVKKGTLLAKVNDKPLLAELSKLEAQLPLAQDRVFRQKSLLAKDAVSQEAYEQVTTELDKLNADIELVKARISQTELRAPFDGEIGLRLVSEGTYASPSTIVAKLTKIKPLKIEFSINERHASSVKKGTNLRFHVQDDMNEYHASVYAVESKLDTRTLTMKARAVYPNANGKLQPGRSASIEIRLEEIRNALTVPSQSVIAEMGRDIAFLYKDGVVQEVELEKGMRTESDIQVIRGLKAGDTLVVTGVMQLRDGMPVTIDNIVE